MTERNSLTGRMKNENFVKNAPQEVLDKTQARIDEINQQASAIEELIKSL